jgi:hypothetical protein
MHFPALWNGQTLSGSCKSSLRMIKSVDPGDNLVGTDRVTGKARHASATPGMALEGRKGDLLAITNKDNHLSTPTLAASADDVLVLSSESTTLL